MEKEDLAGGLVYHPAEVARGVISIEVPYQIIHHGELSKGDLASLRDSVYEASKLVRFQVTYGEVSADPRGEVLEDGHELKFMVGIHPKMMPNSWLYLLSTFGAEGEGFTAKKLVGLGEIGAHEMVNRTRLAEMEAAEVIEAGKRFEGPIWVVQKEEGDGVIENGVG